jgi:O-antigen ligase
VFGVGALRYNTVASQLPPVDVHGVQSVPDPHSSFLEVLAEDGVIGFVALVWAGIAISRLVHDFRKQATDPADAVLGGVLVGAAVSYLLYSLTLEMLPYGPSNQFFALLLGLAAGRLERAGATTRPAHG